MTFRLHRLRRGDEALLARVAAEVFDEPVRPERLGAYLASPDHLKVVALDGDTVVGQCAGVVHLHRTSSRSSTSTRWALPPRTGARASPGQ